MKWRRNLETADLPEGGGSSTKVYEHNDVEIYRGYRSVNGASSEFKVCKITASELELDGGPKLHEKIMALLDEHTKTLDGNKGTIFRHPKDQKAARKIRSFILREIMREFARKPSEFFAWLEQDRKEQRRNGANDLRAQFNNLLEETM